MYVPGDCNILLVFVIYNAIEKKLFYSKFNLTRRKWRNSLLKRFVISDIFVIKAAKILPFVLRNNETQVFL